MSDKRKNDDTPIKRVPFVALWFLMGLLPSLAGAAFRLTSPSSYLNTDQHLIAIYLLGSPLTAFLQVLMIERLFKRSMRGWLIYTLLGTLMTLLIVTRTWPTTATTYQTTAMLMQFAGFVPVLLLQTLWIWRRFKRAWAWPALQLLFVLFNTQLRPLGIESLRVVVASALILLLGALMHYFLAHPRATEKAKVDAAEDSAVDQARLTRLQDAEESATPWIENIAKEAQQEA